MRAFSITIKGQNNFFEIDMPISSRKFNNIMKANNINETYDTISVDCSTAKDCALLSREDKDVFLDMRTLNAMATLQMKVGDSSLTENRKLCLQAMISAFTRDDFRHAAEIIKGHVRHLYNVRNNADLGKYISMNSSLKFMGDNSVEFNRNVYGEDINKILENINPSTFEFEKLGSEVLHQSYSRKIPDFFKWNGNYFNATKYLQNIKDIQADVNELTTSVFCNVARLERIEGPLGREIDAFIKRHNFSEFSAVNINHYNAFKSYPIDFQKTMTQQYANEISKHYDEITAFMKKQYPSIDADKEVFNDYVKNAIAPRVLTVAINSNLKPFQIKELAEKEAAKIDYHELLFGMVKDPNDVLKDYVTEERRRHQTGFLTSPNAVVEKIDNNVGLRNFIEDYSYQLFLVRKLEETNPLITEADIDLVTDEILSDISSSCIELLDSRVSYEDYRLALDGNNKVIETFINKDTNTVQMYSDNKKLSAFPFSTYEKAQEANDRLMDAMVSHEEPEEPTEPAQEDNDR